MQKASVGFGIIEGGKSSRETDQPSTFKFVQTGLFPYGAGRSVIFVYIPGITEQDFVSLVQTAQPAFAVELRRAPRFDIGRLSRETVFKWFKRANCKYLDPAPRSAVDKDDVEGWIRAAADLFRAESGRPIVFFLSTAQDVNALRQSVCNALGCFDGDWQVFELPSSQTCAERAIAK